MNTCLRATFTDSSREEGHSSKVDNQEPVQKLGPAGLHDRPQRINARTCAVSSVAGLVRGAGVYTRGTRQNNHLRQVRGGGGDTGADSKQRSIANGVERHRRRQWHHGLCGISGFVCGMQTFCLGGRPRPLRLTSLGRTTCPSPQTEDARCLHADRSAVRLRQAKNIVCRDSPVTHQNATEGGQSCVQLAQVLHSQCSLP